MQVETSGGYRNAARAPVAAVGETLEETLRPLLRRRLVAWGFLSVAAFASFVALIAR